MNKKHHIILFWVAVYCFISTPQLLAEASLPEKNRIVQQISDRVSAEIVPEIELLSGVLSQTSWMEKHGGPKEQEISTFSPYAHGSPPIENMKPCNWRRS